MIIVSGTERSRTSLTMEILGKLGLDIIGEQWPNKNKNSARLNPHGFYEVTDGTTVRGCEKDYGPNSVIKILLSGLRPRRGRRGVPEETLKSSKVILCLRHPKEIAQSSKELNSNVKVASGTGWKTEMKISPENPSRYISRAFSFVMWLSKNKWFMNNIVPIDTSRYYSDPEVIVGEMCGKLGLDTSRIRDASSVVDPTLYRAGSDYEWSDKAKGELAERIYESLRSLDVDAVADELHKLVESNMHENAKWFDSEFKTNSIIGPSLYRSLAINNRNVRNKLQKSGAFRTIKCENADSSTEEYTLIRPVDIGNLTRPKVFCKKDQSQKTLEECYICKRVGK